MEGGSESCDPMQTSPEHSSAEAWRRPIATTPAPRRAEMGGNSPLGPDRHFLPEGKDKQPGAKRMRRAAFDLESG